MQHSNQPTEDNLKVYLDYLDKEMTIMGILSTFCIITLGFVAEKLFYPDKDSLYKFWNNVTLLCFTGLSGFLIAALSFYRQRSLLAWYYGQLSLYKAKGDDQEVTTLLEDSDAWYNWQWYQTGFGFLSVAFAELGAVCLSSVCPVISNHQALIGIGMLLACSVGTTFFVVAYSKIPV